MKKKEEKEYREMMEKLGMDKYEIEDRLYEYKTLKDWEPITYQELKDIDESWLPFLLSFCWHDGETRCDTIGISNVKFDESNKSPILNYSDGNGDPTIYMCDDWWDRKIHNDGDGSWNYGVYKHVDGKQGVLKYYEKLLKTKMKEETERDMKSYWKETIGGRIEKMKENL